MKRTIVKGMVVGYVTLWAVCQIIAVPLILLKQSFTLLIVIYTTIIVIVCIFGIYRGWLKNAISIKKTTRQSIAIGIMLLFILFVVVQSIRLQLTNDDDSRFVVNAVDIVRSNRLLLTDVNTGGALVTWIGDLYKDVVSPWPVFCAYISKMTGVHVATMMHTILPPVLIFIACCVYWLLAEEFFEGKPIYKSIFVCYVLLFDVYGYYSIYSAETFTMTRIWQGKATLAGIGIPVLVLAFLWLYKGIKGAYINLLITVLGLANLSSMSFILTSIMLLCYGIIYGIAEKKMKMSFCIWSACLINVCYLGISWLLNKG